jgi:hypothetical protein
MAITKILNIKTSGGGNPGRHLHNAIRYIMNPDKTGDGELVGGNAGSQPGEVYAAMQDTKETWGKTSGRQGYHFVISWKPGEANEQQAYDVVREFCEEYLGDNYDYVFAIHDDRDHMHGHVIFNSVNRNDGYKYRYVKGDWEKHIQPVTDKVCERHGLPRLEYDYGNRLGRSYAQWAAEKGGKPVWKKIIRADIDVALAGTGSEDEFLERMKGQGYEVRVGNSRKHGEYASFTAPGQNRAWRSYNLGAGYGWADIRARIGKEGRSRRHGTDPAACRARVRSLVYTRTRFRPVSGFQRRYVRRLYFVTYAHRKATPYAVNQAAVRRSLLHIDRMVEECRYLIRNDIQSEEELARREAELKKEERSLKSQRQGMDFMKESKEYARYKELGRELEATSVWDDRFEEIQDEMEELEGALPDAALSREENKDAIDGRLREVGDEKRTIRHIRKELKADGLMKTGWQKEVTRAREKSAGKGEERTWQKK